VKKQLMMIVALAAVGAAGAQVPKPVWELGRDPIDPAATVGDVRIVDGVVKLDCGNAFALPPDVLGDQKDYTIEIEFRRGAAFQNLPRMEGALKLLSNRDPDAKAGMSLIYFPPGWDRNGGIGNVVGLEVNTYWNGETGGLAGNDFNTYSLVVKDREASLYRNGMLLAMTGAIRPSRRPLALGGAGWRGTARYGVASGPVPEPYELRALRIYDVALAPAGYDPSTGVMRNISGEGYNMQCAVVEDPSLPRILVVGDSISMGYRRFISERLKGRAFVDYWVGGSWFDGSVKPDDFPALRAWDGVLANGPYEVVSWNAMTLHMWNGAPGRVDEANYPGQMDRVLEHLRKTAPGTRFIWVNCTPWRTTPESGRPVLDRERNDRIVRLNAVTDRIMAGHGIPVVDLHALCLTRLDTVSDGCQDAVHWKEEVYREMADKILVEIEKALSKRTRPANTSRKAMP
jgi:hypothetical protein